MSYDATSLSSDGASDAEATDLRGVEAAPRDTYDEISVGSPRLIVISGPQVGVEFPFRDAVSIGRAPQAGLVLEDQRLSRLHAMVRKEMGGGFSLEDLGSRNGTWMQGKAVKRQAIAFGDIFQIGSSSIIFTHNNPLDDQLAHKQKMEMLGQLGASIAHDFNNLLGIAVAAKSYLEELPDDHRMGQEDVTATLEDLGNALTRATELTSRLLGVARQSGQVLQRVNVGALVEEVVQSLRATTPKSIRLDHVVADDLVVHGDKDRLRQILTNLCSNARDAMAGGGTLIVAAQHLTSDNLPAQCRVHKDHVLVTVSDTGCGMDERTKKRAFDPFFTTKERAKGTGLGLASVLENVQFHGGFADIESERGKGTTMGIYLPASATGSRGSVSIRATDDDNAVTTQPDLLVTPASILLADDDEGVRNTLGRLLASQGHRVVYASTGVEVLEKYEAERPDVVLMDIDMPVLNGLQAFDRLAEMDPTAKVLMMSGHWEQAPKKRERKATDPLQPAAFLQKPCSWKELQSALASALE